MPRHGSDFNEQPERVPEIPVNGLESCDVSYHEVYSSTAHC